MEALGVKALPFQLDVQNADKMADLVATANKELGCVRACVRACVCVCLGLGDGMCCRGKT